MNGPTLWIYTPGGSTLGAGVTMPKLNEDIPTGGFFGDKSDKRGVNRGIRLLAILIVRFLECRGGFVCPGIGFVSPGLPIKLVPKPGVDIKPTTGRG